VHHSRLVALAMTFIAYLCLSDPMSAGNAGTRYGTVAFRIKVPGATVKAAIGMRRRPLYVSASTKSFSVLTDAKNPVVANVNPTTGYAVVYVQTSVGTHVFTVTAYDQLGAQGHILSTGTTAPVIVPPIGYAQVLLTLDGIVASVALTLAQAHPTVGSPAVINLDVQALDADGNTIFAGAFTQPFTLTSSDPLDGTLSQTVVGSAVNEQPQYFQRVSVVYSGANVPSVTFSASGPGIITVKPAVLVPVGPPASGQQVIVTGGFEHNAAFSTSNGNQLLATFGQYPLSNGQYGPAAVDPAAGLIYVINYSAANGRFVESYQSSGAYAFVSSFNLPTGLPANVVLDSRAKRLYMTDRLDTNISIASLMFPNPVLGTFPTGFYSAALAVDSTAQRLYVGGCGASCYNDDGLAVFSIAAPYKVLASLRTGMRPFSMALDNGKLYVEEFSANDPHPNAPQAFVDVYDASSLSRLNRIGPFSYPAGTIAIDASGRRLYVLNPQENVSPFVSTVAAYGLDTGLSYLGSFAVTSGSTHVTITPGAPAVPAEHAREVYRYDFAGSCNTCGASADFCERRSMLDPEKTGSAGDERGATGKIEGGRHHER
jgi:hypothetical protein